jgi:hypothetical protein
MGLGHDSVTIECEMDSDAESMAGLREHRKLSSELTAASQTG